tara:strand:+ start:204 stop:770 length:567 start_codon:yes stop_codon:yes gene_type:complete
MTRASDVAKFITNGGTIVDGDIAFASGHGIDFSARSDSSFGSPANDLLDAYEEGTFTPTATYVTSPPDNPDTGAGTYTRIGRMVHVNFNVNNINEAGGSGDLRFTGLPYTSAFMQSVAVFSGTARVNNVNWADTGDGSYLTAEIPDNATYVRIAEHSDSTSVSTDFLTTGNLTSSSDVHVSISYPVTT